MLLKLIINRNNQSAHSSLSQESLIFDQSSGLCFTSSEIALSD